jgi:sodium-dependent dicarboxylate transporter 2/3/5
MNKAQDTANADASTGARTLRALSLAAGPLAAMLCYFLLPDNYIGAGGEPVAFSHAGRATLAMMVWMAIWWLTEALPLAATALLPLVAFPLLGIASASQAAAPYGSDVIWLFFGGFVLAGALQRWGLDRRMAFHTLRWVGTRPNAMIAGIMGATAFISMWVSNTATAALMLPIALSVIDLVLRQRTSEVLGRQGIPAAATDVRAFATALLLGVAYAASIGGLATIVGSPPNGIVVRYIAQTWGETISFTTWLMIAAPFVLLFLPLAWWLLTRWLFRHELPPIESGRRWVNKELAQLGPLERGAKLTLAVFGLAAILWVFGPVLADISIAGIRPLAGLSDSVVAVLAAIALFCLPAGKGRQVLEWDAALQIPWDVLVLFGGGLSLAAAIDRTGVSGYLGSLAVGLAGWPVVLLVLAVVAITTFLSELTSNTAQVATMVPLLAAMAPAVGVHPYLLVIPCAFAASAAFMMPVGTPPNAIVFGTGMIRMGDMCRAGLVLNLCAIALTTLLTFAVIEPLLLRP